MENRTDLDRLTDLEGFEFDTLEIGKAMQDEKDKVLIELIDWSYKIPGNETVFTIWTAKYKNMDKPIYRFYVTEYNIIMLVEADFY